MNLFKKYFTNRLTSADLRDLRRKADAMTDDQLEEEMRRLWMQSAPVPVAAPHRRRYIISAVAASVAVVLCLAAGLLFFGVTIATTSNSFSTATTGAARYCFSPILTIMV